MHKSERRRRIERSIINAVIRAVHRHGVRNFRAIYLSPEDMSALQDTRPKRERAEVDGIPVRLSTATKRPRSVIYGQHGEVFWL